MNATRSNRASQALKHKMLWSVLDPHRYMWCLAYSTLSGRSSTLRGRSSTSGRELSTRRGGVVHRLSTAAEVNGWSVCGVVAGACGAGLPVGGPSPPGLVRRSSPWPVGDGARPPPAAIPVSLRPRPLACQIFVGRLLVNAFATSRAVRRGHHARAWAGIGNATVAACLIVPRRISGSLGADVGTRPGAAIGPFGRESTRSARDADPY
jgi:hypothetical protein